MADETATLSLKKGDCIALLGGTLASRAQYSGYIESRLQTAYPELELTVRNIGWSGDEVDLMPRPLNFGGLTEHLEDKKVDVVFLFFGGNESFKGNGEIDAFVSKYRGFIEEKIVPVTSRFVFVSPIAHEKLDGPHWPDPKERNDQLRAYTGAIRDLATSMKKPFVDLFHPSRTLMAENYSGSPLTINGIHLKDEGYRLVADILASELKWPVSKGESASGGLRELIIEKNRQFFLRWRPVNGEYIFGRRNKPFGIVSYPPEMEQLDRQIAELDKKIHAAAK